MGTSAMSNPFPGLRPFRMEENHLFFGRKNQVSEVLEKLTANKFVAIVGNSGIGKSSFVNCGVLPKLQQNENTTENQWQIVSFRPGSEPLARLTRAFNEKIKQAGINAEKDENNQWLDNSNDMSELAHKFYAETGKKLLIYIDQFEEIFRFNEEHEAGKDIAAFVNLLIRSIRKPDDPINIIITIRSDFVGDCSRYPDFTKAINDSQFLIPQMTREEKRDAIVGPVEVMGAKIDEDLVETILKSIGDRHDQLPLMQHSLMRTWDYWQSVKVGNEPIGLSAYKAIGGMEKALSVHANEIFNELDNDKKKICERLFKSITEKGAEGRSVRRPSSIREIAEIADADTEDVKMIVEHFRKPGRTLLTPSNDIPLKEETVIDISHESLMRIWEVLAEWLEEEHEAIKEYLHIAEAAEKHQLGKGGLMKSPELQMALNWKQENNPTKQWGIRHHKAYDRTMQFLHFSEKKFIQSQRLKEKLQKARLVVFKSIAIVFGIGAIIALAFFFYAQRQRKEAMKQKKMATIQKEKAHKQAIKAEKNAKEAFRQKQIADVEKRKAIQSQIVANEQKQEAMEQRELAEKERIFAMEQKEKAEVAEKQASNLRILSIARSMAVKSLQESDKILKSLSARQAYNLFRNNGGQKTDPDIYSALYYAVKGLKGDDFNTAKAHFDNVRTIATDKNSRFIYSAGSDGQIFKWTYKNGEFSHELIDKEKNKVHKSMAISHNGDYLVVGGNYPYMKLISLHSNKPPQKIDIKTGEILYLGFTPNDNRIIYLGSNKRIMGWDFSKTEEIAKSNLKVNSIDLDPEGTYLAVAKAKGQVVLINLNNNTQKIFFESQTKADITSVKYSNNGDILAVGDMQGLVRVINSETGELLYKLPGHTAMVNQMAFNNAGNRLATASFDHTVRIWSLEHPYKQPILLKDHDDWVWSVEFSQNDRYLLAGCRDNLIRTWLLNIDKMAAMICNDEEINRNFTQEEWDKYVAEDLDYECTCKQNASNKKQGVKGVDVVENTKNPTDIKQTN